VSAPVYLPRCRATEWLRIALKLDCVGHMAVVAPKSLESLFGQQTACLQASPNDVELPNMLGLQMAADLSAHNFKD
jgi:hypothetical protein